VAVYSVAAYGDRWVSLAGLAVAELGLAAIQLTQGRFERLERSTFLLFTGVIAVAWVLGHFVGDRQLYAAQLEERTAELEQAREELARRALRQAERKVGQLTMENEILRAAAEKRGLQVPPAKRPR
jgi:glycine/D-amino acid oxidase-like deaminating enzyme